MAAEQNTLTLTSLITTTRDWDASLSDISVHPGELRIREDGISFAGIPLPLTDKVWDRALDQAGAPASYLAKRSPQLRAAALAEHVDAGDFSAEPRLVFKHGELLTITSGGLIDLTYGEVLGAAADELGPEAESLLLTKIERDDQRLEVELVSPSIAVDVRVGDVVRGGIHIVHERYGEHATLIESFVYRLVCRNGMTRRECPSQGGIARTRKLSTEHPNGRELQIEQIHKLVRQMMDGLRSQLQELRATSERPSNVPELLLRWLQRARISPRRLMPRLLSAWQAEGAEDTHYGAVNAVTRVATHDMELSARQRRVLAALGGLLAFSEVHICPRCFSVLSASDGDPSE